MAHIYKISANIKILLNKIASLYSFSLLNNVHLQKSKKIMIDTDLNVAKKLYPFQEKTVASIMEELEKNNEQHNILYQLPTGGGKTVIFSELSNNILRKQEKKFLF